MAVIFDLDQTLIESQSAETFRRARNWGKVYGMIPSLSPYPGVHQMLKMLNQKNVPYCIVTSSPSSYCTRVIQHWGWNAHSIVAYHDTKRRKPHPDPINLGISKLGSLKEVVVAIGDDPKDIIAAKSAGVVSIAALWGAQNKQALIDTSPDFIFEDVIQLMDFLNNRF